MNSFGVDPFSITVRVYCEDTDVGGIVYHSNYLKFMERARTELLRACGYDHHALLREHRLLVVSEANIGFRKSAKLDDELVVTAAIESVGRVRMTFIQQVLRCGELLCSGRFVIASIHSETMKPATFIESLRNKWCSVTHKP